ncbi:hypothetical protein D3C74_425870 [compost metagenome]
MGSWVVWSVGLIVLVVWVVVWDALVLGWGAVSRFAGLEMFQVIGCSFSTVEISPWDVLGLLWGVGAGWPGAGLG